MHANSILSLSLPHPKPRSGGTMKAEPEEACWGGRGVRVGVRVGGGVVMVCEPHSYPSEESTELFQ